MPIKATAMDDARIPMPPVALNLVIAGEERAETLRLTRRVVSPETRRQAQAEFEQTAPDREEMVRLLVFFDVQSPDILGSDDRPHPLTADYLSTRDDTILRLMCESLEASFVPNAQTSKLTKSS